MGDNPQDYRRLLSEPFGLDIQGYNEKVREFISTKDFLSKHEALDCLLDRLDVSMTYRRKRRFFREFEDWKNKIEVYSDTVKTLQELKRRGCKIGIVSNNNIFVEDLIKKEGIEEYADSIVLSHKIGLIKPDERIYLACLGELNVSALQTTMIGDQLEKDVLTPISLGMQGILFDPQNKSQYGGRKIRKLNELLNHHRQ